MITGVTSIWYLLAQALRISLSAYGGEHPIAGTDQLDRRLPGRFRSKRPSRRQCAAPCAILLLVWV